ncbi:unnamed protein product [Prorocentrum cordatum]|uniref:UBC core domain-containing protein n=1 Tax=Prorocentrum cordatum TaxID=2364126 RepID=A0ABN9Q7C2_9DINO|nr:unnamed protein product [Polarella glacialis]
MKHLTRGVASPRLQEESSKDVSSRSHFGSRDPTPAKPFPRPAGGARQSCAPSRLSAAASLLLLAFAMWDKAALTRLCREYANIQNEQIPHVGARPLETNMLEWHYVLQDLPPETPYSGGVYWGKLKFPEEYPLKPPAIYMFTPSGQFHTNTRLCLSMSATLRFGIPLGA